MARIPVLPADDNLVVNGPIAIASPAFAATYDGRVAYQTKIYQLRLTDSA